MNDIAFAITGASKVAGGIAASNHNNLRSLVDLAAFKKIGLKILSLLEENSDRPVFLPDWVSFKGFKRNKFAFAAELLSLVVRKPVFVFDHVRLAFPLFPFAATGSVRSVIFTHGSESWKRIHPTSRWSFQAASLCLANSNFTLGKMRERIPRFNGEACPLGLSPDFPLNGEAEQLSTSDINLRAADGIYRRLERRVLLLVARIDRREGRKGHLSLINILPALQKKFPDVQLVFPGPGNGQEELIELARKRGVSSSVFLPGWVPPETLKSLYRRCYAFTMPSEQEGFGMVYLEAMSFAKACVGCFDQGAEDIIMHGETGFLVRDPDNSNELLDTLTNLLANPELTQTLGKNGFERLRQFFTAEHYQARVKEKISKIL